MKDNILNTKGFTLIEILVGVAIFGIIVTAIFGSFSTITKSSGRIESGMYYNEMTKNCLGRITDDLQSLYIQVESKYMKQDFNDTPDPYRFKSDYSSAGSSEFALLRFTSYSHFSFNKDEARGIAEIVYYVTENRNDEKVLRRSDRLSFDEEFEENANDPVICEKIKKFKINYYDGNGDLHERWDSDSSENKYSTPGAVEIILETGEEKISYTTGTKIALNVVRDEID